MNKKRLAGVMGLIAGGAVIWAAFFGGHPPALSPPLTFQSGGRVEKLTLSLDGRLLADDCPAGQVKLYDTATGQPQYAFAVRTDWMTFSPDGRRLLTVDMRPPPSAPNGVVQTWDTATGAQVSRFVVPPAPPGAPPAAKPEVTSVSPDLRWVVLRVPPHCAVYDLASGRLLKDLPAPAGRYAVAFSPDARRLAVGDERGSGVAQIWDTTTWQPLQALDKNGAGVTGLRFSPNGARLALGSKAGLTWWDTRTGKPEGRFAMSSLYGLHNFRFSSDSRSLLFNQIDNSPEAMRQVDCDTGREILTAQGQLIQHASSTGNRAESALLGWGFPFLLHRDTFCIWDTGRKQVLYQIKIPPGPNASLMGDFQFHTADLSADGHVFAAGGSDDGVIRVWRLP